MSHIINHKLSTLAQSLHDGEPKPTTLEKPRRLYYFIHYASLAGLGLISLALIFPICASTSQALVLDHQDPKPATISLSLPSTNDIDITPTSAGQFGAVSSKLQVESSSNSGYQVYVSTMDQTNAMVGTKGEIKALTQPSTSRSFLPNTWGYALSQAQAGPETEYQGLPLTPTVAHSTNQATTGTVDTYYLSFGTNIDTSLPAGQYTNNVVISVIANPQKITNLSELTYMQDMTSSICQDTKAANGANTVTPGNEVEKRLIDVRDGKEYWVSKLADQNCWMVQNLALDLNEKTLPLTPASSDVSKEWEPEAYTETEIPSAVSDPSHLGTKSWNLGDYVFTIPAAGLTGCKSADANGDTADQVANITELNNCLNLQSVSHWQPTYTAQSGSWRNVAYDYVTVDASRQVYDAHYLLGNYYQYNTATTESAKDLATPSDPANIINAKYSICPKGWQLPTGNRYFNTDPNYPGQPFDLKYSGYKLLLSYGYPSANQYTTIGGTPILHGTNQNIFKQPFYLTLFGQVSLNSGALQFIGEQTYLWHATVTDTIGYGGVFYLNSHNVYPANGNAKAFGNTVRCLAR